MKTLKGNIEFEQHLITIVNEFEEKLKDAGFNLQLAKLSFNPNAEWGECPCGPEFFIDPDTKKIKSRCRRCPPIIL